MDDVSLTIYKGEIFALLGDPAVASPRCCVCWQVLNNLRRADYARWRRFVTGAALPAPHNMMFQSYALFPHMTVEQNIVLA